MRLASIKSGGLFLAALGLVQQMALASNQVSQPAPAGGAQPFPAGGLASRMLDRCCQSGKLAAADSSAKPGSNCKLGARQALAVASGSGQANGHLSVSLAESLIAREPSFADQCELVAESCCMSVHRGRNCDSGKQFAKDGTSCMDVELNKDTTIATESFNDCCMACSLGILAARTGSPNDTSSGSGGLSSRCKLLSPLASSMSGQLYEQTYVECCLESLPRPSSALIQPGTPVDCQSASNPCSQRCVAKQLEQEADRCECFAGYKLAADGFTCLDVDECKLGTHSCNKLSELCDNTRGSFRCLARQLAGSGSLAPLKQQGSLFGSLPASRLGSSFRSQIDDEFRDDLQDAREDLGKQRRGGLLLPKAESRAGSGVASSLSDGSESSQVSAEFVSLRLCPLGSRWSSERNMCQPIGGASSLLAVHKR